MTNTIVPLSNIRNYDGNLKINTTDGSSFFISVVDDGLGLRVSQYTSFF
jgi:hypothetical protein